MASSGPTKPLRAREQWILAALTEAPLHGYALMETVALMSDGGVRMGPATLYRTLDALSDRDLIEVAAVEAQGERTRTQWRVTPLGRSVLKSEAERLEAQTRRIRRALGGAGE